MEGVYPAMLTPFTQGGKEVDYDRACELATRLADQGVQGILACGTTGEGLLMSIEERKTLVKEILDAVQDRLTVLTQTGSLNTAWAVELTEHAAISGADGAAVVAPPYYEYDEKALIQYYTTIAKAVPGFPVFLYNIPARSGNALTVHLVLDLIESAGNIVGIKDSGGDMQAHSALLSQAPRGFTVFNGTDEYTFQSLFSGAKGSVSSTANVFPDLFLSLYQAVQDRDIDKAWRQQGLLNQVCQVFGYGRTWAYYKEALRFLGFDGGAVRPPQRELLAEEKTFLATEMHGLGLI
jgi:4-hydroxy-tetrahydrodipicolinate synthase